jgi:hypothetical protein
MRLDSQAITCPPNRGNFKRSELRSLAAGLGRDKDAVLAAILFRWSNGQVEGQVNRLKLIKRTMYVGPDSLCSDEEYSQLECQ